MWSLSCVNTNVNGECTPLDKCFVASLKVTREGSFVRMNAPVSGQVRSTAERLQLAMHTAKKHFCAVLPLTGERARILLTIWMIQIDELKNVHSIVGW